MIDVNKGYITVENTFIRLKDAEEGIVRMRFDKDFFEKYCDNLENGEDNRMARAIIRMLYDLPAHCNHT